MRETNFVPYHRYAVAKGENPATLIYIFDVIEDAKERAEFLCRKHRETYYIVEIEAILVVQADPTPVVWEQFPARD